MSNPSRQPQRRPRRIVETEVKLRIVLHRPMRRSALVAAILGIIEGEPVPEEFDIAWWDYAKGSGGRWRHGERLGPEDLGNLEAFKALIMSIDPTGLKVGGQARVRVDRVASE